MLRFRSVLVLVAVAAVLLGLVSVMHREPPAGNEDTGPLLSGLQAQINDVAHIRITKPGEMFSVDRRNGRWVVADRDGYPAQGGAVRDTLLGIVGMQRMEAKTRRPESYGKLQVEDVTQPDAKSILLELRSADNATLAEVLLGKERSGSGDSDWREYYVRRAGDPQSWLVRTDLAPQTELLEWLQQPVLEIDEPRIRRVTVEHPGDATVTVERALPDTTDFTLSTLPDGKQVKYQFAVNDVAGSFGALRLEDVRDASDIDFDGAIRAVMDTFDGLQVTLDSVEVEGQRFARLAAAAREATAPVSNAPAGNNGASAADDPDHSTAPAEAAPETGPGEEAPGATADPAKEAATLNARWDGWAYRLDEFGLGNIIKPLSDLIEDIPAPASTEPDTGPPPDTTAP